MVYFSWKSQTVIDPLSFLSDSSSLTGISNHEKQRQYKYVDRWKYIWTYSVKWIIN